MDSLINFISQPWHWSVSGVGIVITMFLLILLGRRFGISTSFKTLCAIGGAGKKFNFFNYEWKEQYWLLMFVVGAVIGGFIASSFLASPAPVAISDATISDLAELGISYPSTLSEGTGFIPHDIINFESLKSLRGILLMVVGGFFIGFGTRYAGGCTSGHAISGLSELRVFSLVAVIGFFIGGLVMTHLLFPIIFNL